MNRAMVVSFLRTPPAASDLDRGGSRRDTMSLVQDGSVNHDRATGLIDSSPAIPAHADPLRAALQRLRLEGAIFLRAEYREPWSYESLPGPATAQILRPGTDRVILFHVVARGTCWVQVGDGDRHWASAGDVIVLPYGDQHQMGRSGASVHGRNVDLPRSTRLAAGQSRRGH